MKLVNSGRPGSQLLLCWQLTGQAFPKICGHVPSELITQLLICDGLAMKLVNSRSPGAHLLICEGLAMKLVNSGRPDAHLLICDGPAFLARELRKAGYAAADLRQACYEACE